MDNNQQRPAVDLPGDQRSSFAALVAEYESDGEGYPADWWIDKFSALPPLAATPHEAANFLTRDLERICETISCVHVRCEDGKDDFKVGVTRVEYHTGGWSGAESLIDCMLQQFWINHFHTQWRRGGHFWFEVPARFLSQGTPPSDHRTGAAPKAAEIVP